MEPDEIEQRAAWELYVELTTRIVLHPLGPDEGSLREALTSLHSLFGVTRQILRQAGPCVAQSPESFGVAAIEVLNKGLRPFLAKWHPLLSFYEQKCLPDVSPAEHERNWELAQEFRLALSETQTELRVYAEALAKIAGINHNEVNQ